MNERQIDDLARILARSGCSRRRLARAVAGGALGAGLTRVGPEEAVAACGKPGKACRQAGQCCAGKCKGGKCGRCPGGTKACPAGCTDTKTDPLNCDRCRRDCAACVAGFCASEWGASGAGNGQLDGRAGVAVAGLALVCVADAGNHRIQRFDASGNFLDGWGSQRSGIGQFSSPFGVAVDGEGMVYVAALGNDRIQAFDPAWERRTVDAAAGRRRGRFMNGARFDAMVNARAIGSPPKTPANPGVVCRLA